MRLVAAALTALVLAGCVSGSADKYFPPAADLPDGLVPIPSDSPEWRAVAPFLGMQSNPGRLGVLDRLPRQDLGTVASVDAYLLQTNETGIGQSYGIMVLRFSSEADVGPYLAHGEAKACDNKDMAHILRDGLTYVFVGGDGTTPRGGRILRDLTGVVEARSGATVIC
ncbi:MAG: hypothetical protein QOG31_1254 [Thermoplasmata archaeon]|jgi:hypothetical protein|nr:hypothetical protein [Thermoplasmata archaeon]